MNERAAWRAAGPGPARGSGQLARDAREAALAAAEVELARGRDERAAGGSGTAAMLAAVRLLQRASRSGDPSGRIEAMLAEAAVSCCAEAGWLLRAQMIVVARRAAAAALAKDPAQPSALAALGIMSLHAPGSRRRRAETARLHLGAAVAHRPNRVDWRVWLARSHAAAGDPAAAVEELERVRSLMPPGLAERLIEAVFPGARALGRGRAASSGAGPATAAAAEPTPPEPRRRGLAVSARALERAFGARPVLRGVDLELRPREVVGLIGENGAGKSTLLGVLAGRVAPDGGEVLVLGARVVPGSAPASVGYVPQTAGLYPHLSVLEHLRSFALLHGVARRERAERVAAALALAGLEERAGDRASSLSGGMARRLMVALGSLHRPAVLLLDEPVSGIDGPSRERICRMVAELRAEGAAVLCAAPGAEEIPACTDRLLELRCGTLREVDARARAAAGEAGSIRVGVAGAVRDDRRGGDRGAPRGGALEGGGRERGGRPGTRCAE